MTSSGAYFYEPSLGHGLPHDPLNAIIGPRPIGWISSRGLDGSVNLAPYSFFNAFNYSPPIIGFASIGSKDSLRNIRETGEFVWNLVTRPLLAQMNETSRFADYGVDEFKLAKLTKAPSQKISVSRVAESLVNFECKMTQIIQLQNHEHHLLETWLVLGEVVGIHIDQTLLKNGIFDTFGAEIMLRSGGASSYAVIQPEARIDLHRPRE
jgi:flavin reductase (DIM6/NTAB) family NADH-FMN oxidoreductase RutF